LLSFAFFAVKLHNSFVVSFDISMRIAVNTRFLLKDRLEGIGWYTFETLKRITQAHPEHEFYFFFDRAYDPSFIFGKNVHPMVLNPPARHPVLWYLWFEYAVPRALKQVKADVFLSTDAYLSLSTHVPTVLVIHDLAFEHFPQHVPALARWYYRHYTPLYAKRAVQIATVSHFSKNDIIERYGIADDKITVTWNGVNDRYKNIDPQQIRAAKEKFTGGKDYFIYAGSINARKNIGNLFKAFDQFKAETASDIKLVIAGAKGWSYEDTMAVYEQMRYKNEVILTGHLPAEDLSALVGGALALAYVSLFEGFGIPLIEAMQAGVPVITSNVSSLPEVAGDAAILVDPNSIEQIADAMKRIYKEPALRTELILKGKQQAAKFSWDTTAEKLWSVVERVLQGVIR
jgi:glycosyltransferase involved in cell wall biosynthesis